MLELSTEDAGMGMQDWALNCKSGLPKSDLTSAIQLLGQRHEVGAGPGGNTHFPLFPIKHSLSHTPTHKHTHVHMHTEQIRHPTEPKVIHLLKTERQAPFSPLAQCSSFPAYHWPCLAWVVSGAPKLISFFFFIRSKTT